MDLSTFQHKVLPRAPACDASEKRELVNKEAWNEKISAIKATAQVTASEHGLTKARSSTAQMKNFFADTKRMLLRGIS